MCNKNSRVASVIGDYIDMKMHNVATKVSNSLSDFDVVESAATAAAC